MNEERTKSPPSKIMMFKNIIRSYRLRQWVKSGFILAPALFTLHFLEPKTWAHLILSVLGFSLVSSAVYIFNDLTNRDEDRLHPTKKTRPIASGNLQTLPAFFGLILALIVGMILLVVASGKGAIIGGSYFLLMVLYSIWLRRVPIVDIIIVAVGFVMRVILGSIIINEPLSHWMLLCTFTIALYLGLVKRRQEIAAMDQSDNSGRKVLVSYPLLSVIDSWITVLTAMTLIFYALYTVDPRTVEKHHTSALIYTLPLVLYGIFRYQKLAVNDRAGEDPAALVVRDGGIKITVVLWVVAVASILTLARKV